jgi:molybdenum cofactor cytidylyltransferase
VRTENWSIARAQRPSPDVRASVSALLLAAGESTRMGRQKALLPWQDTTLLEYQLTRLAAVDAIAEIVVVTGHEPDEIERMATQSARTVVARNDAYRVGKVSSIRAGLSGIAEENDILLLAVDQPRTSEVHRTLIQRHHSAGAMITVPVHAGRRGHPIVFSGTLMSELLAISEATQGVRAVLQRHPVLEVGFEDPIVVLDLNTPADLDQALT